MEGQYYSDYLNSSQKELDRIIDEVINSYSSSSNGKKLVDHTMSRIKNSDSAQNKLINKGLAPTYENMRTYLRDMVGARIICPFSCNVYKMAELLHNYPGFKVDLVEDYIAVPKESGYSSYHMNVTYPIIANGNVENTTSEIQIRTMAQDLWATLEHDLRYKLPDGISEEVKDDLTEKFSSSALNIRIFDHDMASLKVKVDKLVNKCKKEKDTSTDNSNNKYFLDDIRLSSLYHDYYEANIILQNLLKIVITDYEKNTNEKILDHSKCRVKTYPSTIEKLTRKGFDLSYESMVENISDGVGIRLVCPFLSDVYKMVSLIKNIPDIDIYKEKDYISNPKESGYSSYHFNVNIPVSSGRKVKCEIQIRTMAMDLWATLDRELRYKTPDDIQTLLNDDFLRIAKDMRHFDGEMDDIKCTIDNIQNKGKTFIKQ